MIYSCRTSSSLSINILNNLNINSMSMRSSASLLSGLSLISRSLDDSNKKKKKKKKKKEVKLEADFSQLAFMRIVCQHIPFINSLVISC